MAAANTVKVTFLGDAKGLAQAASAAQAQIDKVSNSVKKSSAIGSFVGTMAGGLASGALGKVQEFASGAVDAFARIEDATGAAGVQFGDQLPAITAFADQAAQSFGISKGAALDAANTFGTLGKAAGLSGTDLSGFATNLSGLAGDLASFKGTSTEQAIDAVGAALRGESEPIRAYGVMLDDATLKAEAMSMGLLKATKNSDAIKAAQMRQNLAQQALNKAIKEHGADSTEAQRAQLALTTANNGVKKATEGTIGPLTQSQKILAAQSAITKQTKDAQGDFARTSDSTANTQKRLAAETENAQAKLGQQLAPAMTLVREAMLKGIQAASKLSSGISGLANFVNQNRGAFAAFAAVVTAVVLPAMARMVAQWIATGVQATISAAKQAAAWLMQQGAAYRAVAAMAVSFAATIAGWIRAGATAMAQAARMAAAWLISIGPIAIAIAAVVGAVVLIIKNWDKIKAATAKAWDFIKSLVQKAINGIVTIFMNFTGPGIIIKHFDKIKQGVSDAVGKVVGFMRELPGKIVSAVGNLGSLLKDAGWDVIEGFVDGLKNGANNLIQAAIDFALDKIPGWAKKVLHINSPSKLMIPVGEGVSEGVAVGITEGSDLVKKAAEKLAEHAKTMVEKLKDKLADARDFAQGIRDSFRDMGQVTSLETGGWTDDSVPAEDLVAQLRQKAAAAAEFVKNMAALRAKGLNAGTLAELRDAGPGSLSATRALLGSDIGQVNALVGQINRVGSAFSNTETRRAFGIDPNARLSGAEARVILDVQGGEDDLKRLIRKWIRAEGGNVQKVLGTL